MNKPKTLALPVKLRRKKIDTGAYHLVDAVNPHQVYAEAHVASPNWWKWSLVKGLAFSDPKVQTEGYSNLLVTGQNKVNALINKYGVTFTDEGATVAKNIPSNEGDDIRIMSWGMITNVVSTVEYSGVINRTHMEKWLIDAGRGETIEDMSLEDAQAYLEEFEIEPTSVTTEPEKRLSELSYFEEA